MAEPTSMRWTHSAGLHCTWLLVQARQPGTPPRHVGPRFSVCRSDWCHELAHRLSGLTGPSASRPYMLWDLAKLQHLLGQAIPDIRSGDGCRPAIGSDT